MSSTELQNAPREAFFIGGGPASVALGDRLGNPPLRPAAKLVAVVPAVTATPSVTVTKEPVSIMAAPVAAPAATQAPRTYRDDWIESPSLRAEFGGNVEAYKHWLKADSEGRAKIYGGHKKEGV